MGDESCTADVGASEASEPRSGRDHSSEIERMDRKAANSVRRGGRRPGTPGGIVGGVGGDWA